MRALVIAVSLALSACTPFNLGGLAQAPAPLASTAIDEKGLILALQTFDTVLTGVDRLVAAGVIKPRSPRAIQIADVIETAKTAYQAASAAQRAGNSSSYYVAIGQAQAAVAQINLLIKG
jgi:hypothetical protein